MTKMPRRNFLGTTLTGTFAAPALLSQLRGADSAPPLRLGLIGCGGYGRANINNAFKVGGVELVAICDADSAHLEETAQMVEQKQGRRPKGFKLYDEMLSVPELQAVVIATPPHWHALQFIAALDRGLDIYCEKPLAYDVREGQAMRTAAQRADRVVQIGFQRRQAEAIRQAREYLQAGSAGPLVQVEAQIHYQAGFKDTTPQDPPPTLDWDLWCGPAPKLPYCPQIGHVNWRLEKEYGHGHLVDWGIHLIDATRWILGEGSPKSVTAAGGLYYYRDKITTPDVLVAHFDFATCPVTWRHHIWGAAEYTPEVSNGIFFRGEKETVFVTDDRWVVIPRDRNVPRRETVVGSDAGKAHMEAFLAAVRTRGEATCTVDDAWRSTTAVQLAMASYETGTRVVWDDATATMVGNPTAAALLKRDYRSPWVHPYS